MRKMIRSLAAICAGTVVFSLVAAKPASAAYLEKPFLDSIKDTLSILRYLNKQVEDIEVRRLVPQVARAETERQYELQKRLYDAEVARGDAVRIAYFEKYLRGLESQLEKLDAFEFSKLYEDQLTPLRAQITRYTAELDMKITQYEGLFGKRPNVEMKLKEVNPPRPARPPSERYFIQITQTTP